VTLPSAAKLGSAQAIWLGTRSTRKPGAFGAIVGSMHTHATRGLIGEVGGTATFPINLLKTSYSVALAGPAVSPPASTASSPSVQYRCVFQSAVMSPIIGVPS
jgi:hypothetical protein